MGQLMGAREIELMLGVSRQRVQQLVKHRDFPRPMDRLAMGAVWRRRDVEKWARATGRMSNE
jgi:predicted DNA-binding transcriptional regulator AlpA